MSKISKKDTTYTKLFVGNIPYGTNDETLRLHFEKFGPLEEAVVIRSKNDNASKGYGFVTMKDEHGAQRACEDKKPLIDGRRANVQLAYLGAKKKTKDGPSKLFSNGTISKSYGAPPPPFMIPSSMVFPNGQQTYVMASSPSSPPPPISPIAGPLSPPGQGQVFFEYAPYLAGTQTVFYGGTLYDQNFLPAGQVILSSPGFPPQTYLQPLSPPPPPAPMPMTVSTCQHTQFYLQNGEPGLSPPPSTQPMLVNQ